MTYHGTHFFVGINGEEFFVGWWPKWHGRVQWKSAEDGRTWMWPYFWFGTYK